ncbi:hypothetical protein AAFF_G00293200 [Aldrovandia affinis]|uniref:Uncharacterized protein n=1 Tax=Aldrovandia affinis TaxID=143900 RepID=A0AAD7SQM8_9TELE|nr:hypothetical protein AAFF_G00293200 [Aldrovandia affinis]
MEVKMNSEEDGTGLDLPNGSAQTPKRGRGRPLGSVNKWPKPVRIPGKVGRPRKLVEPSSPVKAPVTGRKPGRTPKKIKRRGRPRKIPLTPEEEEERKKMKTKPKGPRMWKPLGRPRIYPRVEAPVPPTPSEPRGRGRPRKSKQGAHFRKSNLSPAVSPRPPAADGLPRKRGRPPASFKNSAAKLSVSSPTSEGDSEQKEASPPPTKRVRHSSGEAEKDAVESQGAEESPPVVNQRKRGRRRGTLKSAAARRHEGKD